MSNINTVYQTVLALANKEQRGYITPHEFNLFAKQAQLDIFEQYFYDLSQFKRVPGNQSDYADIIGILEDKISFFIQQGGSYIISSTNSAISLEDDFYRMTIATLDGNTIEKTTREQQELYNTPLTSPTKQRPIFYLNKGSLYVRPSTGTVIYSYIRKPKDPNWTYVTFGDNKNVAFNPSSNDYQDFELRPEENEKLIQKILLMAGVAIQDYNVASLAGQQEVKDIQQQKS